MNQTTFRGARVAWPMSSTIHAARAFVLAFALTGLPAVALAGSGGPEADSGEAPAVVVSATRLPTPAEQVASTVTVIDAADIERKQYRTVVEALQSVPSLSIVRNGGPGKLSSVFFRGANANQTLVRVDGIEMNDPSNPDGRIDLSHILIGDVERIEVLHGPQGMLYGSDTIGGVISIFTKRGTEELAGSLALEAGTFNTFNQFANLSGGDGTVDYSVNLQHQKTDGISVLSDRFRQPNGVLDDDGAENLTLSGNLGVVASETLEFTVTGRYTDSQNDLDLNVFPVRDDSDSRSDAQRWFLGANGRLWLFDGASEHRLGVTYSRINRKDRDDPDPVNSFDFLRDSNKGRRSKIELQNDVYVWEDHTVTLGLETEEERIDSTLVSTSLFGPFTQSAKATADNDAVYLQDQFRFAGTVFGTVGVRRDDHEFFGHKWTYRVAPVYVHPSTGTRLRGSLSTGFKAPTLFQLFGSSVSSFGPFVGNPNLEPEESKGWEVGVEQPLMQDGARIGATYYENDIDNLISFTPDFSTNANIAKVETFGVEAFARATLPRAVTTSLTYAYTRARDANTGLELRRRPLHKVVLDASWQPIAAYVLSGEFIAIGRRFDTDTVTGARIRRGGYGLVNVSTSYQVQRHLRFFGRIENLLNRRYEEPDGFNQPTLGVFAGVRLSL